jgi:hypothetical protein
MLTAGVDGKLTAPGDLRHPNELATVARILGSIQQWIAANVH